MFKRHKIGRSRSRRSFTRGARNVHSRNTWTGPMRGGIRL